MLYNDDTLRPNGLILAWPANLMGDDYVTVDPDSDLYLIGLLHGGNSGKGHSHLSAMPFLFI